MLYNRCTGIYNFGNNTYPRRIRSRSNLCHIFREKKSVLWARKYGIFVSRPQQSPLVLQVPITIGTTVSDSCNVSCTVNNFINVILHSKDHQNNKAQKIYMKNMCTPALTAPYPLSLIWDLILCYWHTHYLPTRSEI